MKIFSILLFLITVVAYGDEVEKDVNKPANAVIEDVQKINPTYPEGKGYWDKDGVLKSGVPPTPVVSEPTPVVSEPTPEPTETNAPPAADVSVVLIPPSPPLQPLLLTEYMMRDGGRRRLPTWIELYNPNPEPVSLDDWVLTWASQRFANRPWNYYTHTIDNFSIPAETAVILVSHITRFTEGIDEDHVYSLNVVPSRALKAGWKLTDAEGEVFFSIGKAFDAERVVLNGSWRERESHERYKSTKPSETIYYGRENDKGSPGHFEQAPAAPSAPKRTITGLWANLRKQQ